MSIDSKVPGFWTMQVGDREASLKALEDKIREQGGNPCEALDLLRTDREYASRIAQAMIRKGLMGSTIGLRLARAILDRNIFTDADWMSYYQVQFTKKQIREAGKFPWSEEVLNSACPFCGKVVKECHFAFWGIDRINGSLLTVAKRPPTGQPKFYFNDNPWHMGQPHTDIATMKRRWYLLHKEIVPGFTGKTPEDLLKMLPPEYEVPTTIVQVSGSVLGFKKTGERFNRSKWAACAERTVATTKVSAGHVSCVGYFHENGLRVGYWYGYPDSNVGLGASRKF